MANETKYFVLVSAQIPREFDALDASGEHGIVEGPENTLIEGWDHRVYEVPEFGSLEGVKITKSNRFVAQLQGPSLTELECWPHEVGVIGDMRSWGSEYRIVTPSGDYVCIQPDSQSRCYRSFEPQRFGLKPFPTWDMEAELGQDLTADLFDE